MTAQSRLLSFSRMVMMVFTTLAMLAATSSISRATNASPPHVPALPYLTPVMGQLPPMPLWKSADPILSGAGVKDCWDCPELIVVEPGKFQMGAAPNEEARFSITPRYRERAAPQHLVEFNTPFAVGRAEVTRGEFARFTKATGHIANGCWLIVEESWAYFADRNWQYPGFEQSDSDPVVCVSWEDARAYTSWLSKMTGENYRLLSEAEWEYAARAGTTTARWWGNEIGIQNANCAGCLDRQQSPSVAITAPVGAFHANPYGLHDMLGNVSEWVDDCWHDNYVGAPTNGKSWELGRCEFRTFRGGSWLSPPTDLRSAHRDRETPGFRSTMLGFRIARTLRLGK